MHVSPVISLFDEVTQAKIIAAAPQFNLPVVEPPKVPLYWMQRGDFFEYPCIWYTVSPAERDAKVEEGFAQFPVTMRCYAFQGTGTVPLYRFPVPGWHGGRSLYGLGYEEYMKHSGAKDERTVVGYVYPSPHPGTVPLRAWILENGCFRVFTDANAKVPEKTHMIVGIICYVFPA